MAKCIHCEREATVAGLCKRDYMYAYYWQNQGVARAMKHRGNLFRRQGILEDLRPANVHVLRRQKRA